MLKKKKNNDESRSMHECITENKELCSLFCQVEAPPELPELHGDQYQSSQSSEETQAAKHATRKSAQK